MVHELECPVCDGIASLQIEDGNHTFRKEKFDIHSYFYKCAKCGEEFTTTELDHINLAQVYNQYREAHNIPSAEQFKLIRERYDLSAARMSLILGIGQNQYSLYESGDIPNESNSQLISLIMDPEIFKKHLLKRKSILQPKDFDKIVEHLDSVILEEQENANCYESFFFNPFSSPSDLNGFQSTSLAKFANMVIFFLQDAFLVTRLNKYLFYSDFLNYKNTGFSISGYNYAAIPLGPVPQDYKTVYDLLEEHNYILTEPYETEFDFTEKFVLAKEFDSSLFSQIELESLKTVRQKFATLKTKKIIDMSHEELGWLENKDRKDLISYQKYASLLKHF
ncbi:MAG: type II TA system antitoxin MqsA family protein [Bacteroidota bacterium]